MINFKIALLNIKAKKFKYIIIFLLIIITSISIYTGDILLNGMENGLKTSQDKLGADIIVVPFGYKEDVENALFEGIPCTLTFSREYESKIKEINGIKEISTQLYLATLPGESCCDGEIQLIAINPQDDFLISPWLEDNKITSLENDEIILGANFKIPIGDTLTYYNKEFTVVAIMDKTGIGYDSSAFISFEAANEILQDKENQNKFNFTSSQDTCSMIFIRCEDKTNPDILKEIIKGKFGTQIDVYSMDSKLNQYIKEINNFKVFGIIMNILLIIITTISLLAINMITTIQRKNEIGSMLTVGITKWRIMTIFLIEYLIIAFCAIVLSIFSIEIITILFQTTIRTTLQIPFIMASNVKLFEIIMKLFIINIIIMIVSLSSAFTWIYKKSPSEMIKEVS